MASAGSSSQQQFVPQSRTREVPLLSKSTYETLLTGADVQKNSETWKRLKWGHQVKDPEDKSEPLYPIKDVAPEKCAISSALSVCRLYHVHRGDETGLFVVKILRTTSTTWKWVESELEIHGILYKTKHPNILPIFGIAIPRTGNPILATPFAKGATLEYAMSRWTTIGYSLLSQRIGIAIQALDGAHFIHSQGYVHLDYKPENLLLHDSKVWIADFGAAAKIDGEKVLPWAGTQGYSIPKRTVPLNKDEREDAAIIREYGHTFPNKIRDNFALGLILVRLVTGIKWKQAFELTILSCHGQQDSLYLKLLDFLNHGPLPLNLQGSEECSYIITSVIWSLICVPLTSRLDDTQYYPLSTAAQALKQALIYCISPEGQ